MIITAEQVQAWTAEIEDLKLALIRAAAENAQLKDRIATLVELREYDRKEVYRLRELVHGGYKEGMP